MIQRAKAQDALAMTQEREIAYLSQTLTLKNPLNEAELQLARTKVAELNTAIQREGIKKGCDSVRDCSIKTYRPRRQRT